MVLLLALFVKGLQLCHSSTRAGRSLTPTQRWGFRPPVPIVPSELGSSLVGVLLGGVSFTLPL